MVGQLRVNEDQIDAAIRQFDDTFQLMAKYCWRIPGLQNTSEGGLSLEGFHALREALMMTKTNYLQSLSDIDHLLQLGETYYDALKGKKGKWISLLMSLLLWRIP